MTPATYRLQNASNKLYCAARNEPSPACGLRRASLGLIAAALEFAAARAAVEAENAANAPAELAEISRRLAARGL